MIVIYSHCGYGMFKIKNKLSCKSQNIAEVIEISSIDIRNTTEKKVRAVNQAS